jgi:Fe-S cluster assembly scaffold protein SufB
MHCTELARDRVVAKAEPIVYLGQPVAKVTHEAAIGTVDRKQLETLMAHGLTPDEAVDVIIMGCSAEPEDRRHARPLNR